jgi:hypothetical protein
LIAVPLMLAGTEVAHALAYRIVYPIAAIRWHLLSATGHGYLGYVPLALGFVAAMTLLGVVSSAVDAARGTPVRALPAWVFGLLPLTGFTLQEFLERWWATSSVPWWMFEQPTFRVGLLLQLPFALLAYVGARLLRRVGRALGRILVGRTRPVVLGVPLVVRPAPSVALRSSTLQRGWSVRGPPAFSV